MAVAQKQWLGEHEMLLSPALAGTLRGDRLPVPLRMLRRVPAQRTVTGYLGGVGVRPEHAPKFARRNAWRLRFPSRRASRSRTA